MISLYHMFSFMPLLLLISTCDNSESRRFFCDLSTDIPHFSAGSPSFSENRILPDIFPFLLLSAFYSIQRFRSKRSADRIQDFSFCDHFTAADDISIFRFLLISSFLSSRESSDGSRIPFSPDQNPDLLPDVIFLL